MSKTQQSNTRKWNIKAISKHKGETYGSPRLSVRFRWIFFSRPLWASIFRSLDPSSCWPVPNYQTTLWQEREAYERTDIASNSRNTTHRRLRKAHWNWLDWSWPEQWCEYIQQSVVWRQGARQVGFVGKVSVTHWYVVAHACSAYCHALLSTRKIKFRFRRHLRN